MKRLFFFFTVIMCMLIHFHSAQAQDEKAPPSPHDSLFSVLWSEESSDEMSSLGFFYLGEQKKEGLYLGFGGWVFGSWSSEPDVDAPIPHSDYRTTSADRGGIGLLGLGGVEVFNGFYLFGGAGVDYVQTSYIDTSNVTGWTWNGGSDDREWRGSYEGSVYIVPTDDWGIAAGYGNNRQWFFGLVFSY